jgi:hypothetical protein
MSDSIEPGMTTSPDTNHAVHRREGLLESSGLISSASTSVQRLTVLLMADIAARSDVPDDLCRRAQNLIDHLPARAGADA